jgi:hypothetical protein
MSRSQDHHQQVAGVHLSAHLSMRSRSLLLVPLLTLASVAQNNFAKSATGTVTGHVYCADTNAPARMASVQLEPVSDAEKQSGPQSLDDPPGGVVQTALDGGFVIRNTAPGSYYVIASKLGYLSPRPHDDDSDIAEPQPPAGQPPIVIPRVDVQADQTASIDIRLERGGAISGTVRFDDGSPASGVMLAVLHRSKDKWVSSNRPAFTTGSPPATDDIGRYRISGLRSREYLVMVQVSFIDLESRGTHGTALFSIQRSLLKIYSGDTPHISDAVPIQLGAGEECDGEDITIPLSKFHSISGVVTAVSDGHPINSGRLAIEDPKDKESVVDAELSNDGTFHLEGVPEGTYILRVQDPRDQQIQENSVGESQNFAFTKVNTLHQYGNLEQTIKVEGDIANLVLAVPEQAKQHPTTSP